MLFKLDDATVINLAYVSAMQYDFKPEAEDYWRVLFWINGLQVTSEWMSLDKADDLVEQVTELMGGLTNADA